MAPSCVCIRYDAALLDSRSPRDQTENKFLARRLGLPRGRVCQVAWAAVTKHGGLEGLSATRAFSHSSEIEKSEVKVPAGLASSPAFLLGSKRAVSSLCLVISSSLCLGLGPNLLSLYGHQANDLTLI